MTEQFIDDKVSFRHHVLFLLERGEAPSAYELFEAHQHFLSDLELQLLYCEVLVKIGRYEKVQALAQQIIAVEKDNDEALNYLNLVSSATSPPADYESRSANRGYHTSIPQPFLGRLQDSVHHYRYKGIQMVKSPFDIALYPLMIWNLKPQTIIEIGSKEGGSAVWLADQVRNFQLDCRIYSIDLLPVDSVHDPLVTFYKGNGRSLGDVLSDDVLAKLPRPWLVIEDADHSEQTSMAVLRFFHRWLDAGDLIVVEDGIMSDLYPEAFPNASSGPHLALKRFLSEFHLDYKIESEYCDFFGFNVTWSSNGILSRLTPIQPRS